MAEQGFSVASEDRFSRNFRSQTNQPCLRGDFYPIEGATTATMLRYSQSELPDDIRVPSAGTTRSNTSLSLGRTGTEDIWKPYKAVKFVSASVFFVCALAIPVWVFYDVLLLSPLFAIMGIIASSTFYAMSWFGEREIKKLHNTSAHGG